MPEGQPSGDAASQISPKSAVFACLMRFGGCFGRKNAWSFSMLLDAVFLRLGHVAYEVLNLVNVDGVEILV